MVVPDFNISVDELKEQDGFKVRLAIAKAYDRDRVIQRGLFGRAVPAFGTINPAMGFFFDTAINDTSEQRFESRSGTTDVSGCWISPMVKDSQL